MTSNNTPIPTELTLIKEFRSTAPALTEAQLAAGRHSLMSALLTEPTRTTRRSSRSSLVRQRAPLGVAFAGVLAVFVALATLLPAAGRQGTTSSAVKLTLAAKILRGAARHYAHLANAGGIAEPGPKQWIYETWAQTGPDHDVPSGVFWTTFDGTQTADISHGRVVVEPMGAAAGSGSSVLHTFDVDPSPMNTYNALASLAQDDPSTLLAAVHDEVTKDPPDWVASWEVAHNTLSPADAQEYEWLQMLLQNTLIAPPGAESAVFRAMSTLPGLSVEQGLTSATGAPAQGISYDGGITDLLFSPGDDAYIGVRSIDTPVGSSPTDTAPASTSTTATPHTTSTGTTPGSSTDGLTIWTITSVALARGPGIK
jgi:hypothetical protein